METAALPIAGKTLADGETPQESALAALAAISSHLDSDESLPALFGRLSATAASLTRARRAAFWRLGPRGTLALQPAPYGFADASAIHVARLQMGAEGQRVIERAVFTGDLEVARGTSEPLDAVWRRAGMTDVRCSIAAAWRAGDRRIGVVAAYDARRGFTPEDLAMLRMAGMAAGLLWQYREAEDKLTRTAARLDQAVAARRKLLNNIAAGGDEARRRFASTLHDDSLQLLTGAELQLERLRAEVNGDPRGRQLEQLSGTLHKVEDSLRRLLIDVSPEPLQSPSDLGDAIRERLETLRIRAGIEFQSNLRIPIEVPREIHTSVIRNVGEALNNVEKHARATRVTLVVSTEDGGLRVTVSDDGTGFVTHDASRIPGHIGLVAMRERAQLAGGWFRIASDPGAGTRLDFWVPLA